jgi:hypothetical protein
MFGPHVVMARRQFWKTQCVWQQSHLLEWGSGFRVEEFLVQGQGLEPWHWWLRDLLEIVDIAD